jgi:glutamate synthase (NADPH/NADH) small chain
VHDHLSAGVYEIELLEYEDDERTARPADALRDETGSKRAERILENWRLERMNFVRIETSEYQRSATRPRVGKVTGFLEVPRQGPSYRPVPVRLRDWREVYAPQSDEEIAAQGRGAWTAVFPSACRAARSAIASRPSTTRLSLALGEAAEQLFDTNNFPEFTGRLCPAPCESACVLGISERPRDHRANRVRGRRTRLRERFRRRQRHPSETGHRVAVVGSGPAGLAAAAQLRSVGHEVQRL